MLTVTLPSGATHTILNPPRSARVAYILDCTQSAPYNTQVDALRNELSELDCHDVIEAANRSAVFSRLYETEKALRVELLPEVRDFASLPAYRWLEACVRWKEAKEWIGKTRTLAFSKSEGAWLKEKLQRLFPYGTVVVVRVER